MHDCSLRVVSYLRNPGRRSWSGGDRNSVGLICKNNCKTPGRVSAGLRFRAAELLSTYFPMDFDHQDVYGNWLGSKLVMQKRTLGGVMKNHKWLDDVIKIYILPRSSLLVAPGVGTSTIRHKLLCCNSKIQILGFMRKRGTKEEIELRR